MRALIIALSVCLICSCTKKKEDPFVPSTPKKFQTYTFFGMGTLVQVTADISQDEANALALYMTELEDRIVTEQNEVSLGMAEVSTETCGLLETAFKYYTLSEGRFNVGITTLSSLYGFPSGPYNLPDDKEVAEAIALIKSRTVVLSERGGKCYASGAGLKVDLGAFAKGWIVDQAATWLKEKGLQDFIINAGGDLYAAGDKGDRKWALGITDPDKQASHIATVYIKDRAVATSGIYERYFDTDEGRRISHIFDGQNGEPVTRYKSISVIADSVEDADLYATYYYFYTVDEIRAQCTKNKTAVFIVTSEDDMHSLCGWENYL